MAVATNITCNNNYVTYSCHLHTNYNSGSSSRSCYIVQIKLSKEECASYEYYHVIRVTKLTNFSQRINQKDLLVQKYRYELESDEFVERWNLQYTSTLNTSSVRKSPQTIYAIFALVDWLSVNNLAYSGDPSYIHRYHIITDNVSSVALCNLHLLRYDTLTPPSKSKGQQPPPSKKKKESVPVDIDQLVFKSAVPMNVSKLSPLQNVSLKTQYKNYALKLSILIDIFPSIKNKKSSNEVWCVQLFNDLKLLHTTYKQYYNAEHKYTLQQ